MGHTVWSQRIVLDVLRSELRAYGRALRQRDRDALERILAVPMQRVACISFANSMHAWAFLLLSIIIEQERKLEVMHESMAHGRVAGREQDSAVDQDAR